MEHLFLATYMCNRCTTAFKSPAVSALMDHYGHVCTPSRQTGSLANETPHLREVSRPLTIYDYISHSTKAEMEPARNPILSWSSSEQRICSRRLSPCVGTLPKEISLRSECPRLTDESLHVLHCPRESSSYE